MSELYVASLKDDAFFHRLMVQVSAFPWRSSDIMCLIGSDSNVVTRVLRARIR